MDAGPGDAGMDLPDRYVGVDVPSGCVPSTELCDGLDQNCNAVPDDGFLCVQSMSTSCTTACGTPGVGLCNTTCDGITGACLAAVEVCGNGCDDDGNGLPDDGCAMGPPNDHCDGAQLLAGAGVLGGVSLAGATNDVTACGGVDVFYAVDVTQESFVYLDTFGSGFDTIIKRAGSDCATPPTSPSCVDDSCGGGESQLADLLAPGRYYFAIGAAAAAVGALTVHYRIAPAAGGEDRPMPTSGHVDGTTSGVDAVTHTCPGATSGAPEDGYWWVQCPGPARHVVVDTCASQTNYDSVLYVAGPAFDLCNDDGPTSCGQDSKLDFMAIGPGLFEVFVDGWNGAAGNYRFTVGMF